MKSQEVKVRLLEHLLYRGGYHAAFTEYNGPGCDGIADVLGITKALLTHEFEIKVEAGDLRGELKSIQYLLAGGGSSFGGQHKKVIKHRHYLNGYSYMSTNLPNRFSFVVPPNLSTLALEGTRGSSYGVISFHDDGTLVIRKPAVPIHKERISTQQERYLIRKAAMEVQNLRHKLFYMGVEEANAASKIIENET